MTRQKNLTRSKSLLTLSAASILVACILPFTAEGATKFSVTPTSKLASSASCKLSLQSSMKDFPNTLGFPRPVVVGNLKKPQVLIIPYSFADTSSPVLPAAYVNSITKLIAQYYSQQSYGKMQISFSTTPIDKSTGLPAEIKLGPYATDFNYQYVDENHNDTRAFVIKLAAAANPLWHLENYESVVFQSTDRRMANTGIAFTSTSKEAIKDQILSPTGLVRSAVISIAGYPVVNHELGHALLRFMDLYTNYTSKYDLMGDGYNLDDNLFAWHRWLAGWVTDSQVRCLESAGTTSHHLSSVNMSNPEAKMIVVHRSPSIAVVVEQRNGGLILYSIDVNVPSGQGPIRVYDNKGEVFSKANTKFSQFGLVIQIKSCNAKGCDFTLNNSKRFEAELVASPSNTNMPLPVQVDPAPTSTQAPLDLSKVGLGQGCNGYAGTKATAADGQTLLCKIEADGNTHWVVA